MTRLVTFLILFGFAYLNAQNLERGPYLQTGTPTSVIVRWDTGDATNSRVKFSTDPNNLSSMIDSLAKTTKHEITISGLLSDTKYYYSVGSTSDTLVIGLDYFFITAPVAGTNKKSRIWVLGDSGTRTEKQMNVRDAYYTFTDGIHTNLWVMLGDNAYSDGTDIQYQEAVFDMYPAMLRKSVLWPAFGNHDGRSSSSSTQSGPFYDIFSLPVNGDAGGVATGTEAYYSFDYANVHFICLNSHDISRSATGPMLSWLVDDLASNTQDWTIAFWHHPPYTKGSHDSDATWDDEGKMGDMRRNALPILENSGVDLVLSGHSHSYERSYLLDGHYGLSNTLTSEMKIDGGDGREDGDNAYHKPTLGSASHEGAVYIVAGSSGKTSGGFLNHPAIFTSINVLGSVILDVDDNRLDVTFLDDNGTSRDYFTLLKGDPVYITPQKTVPKDFALYQNKPNPFNPSTIIKFDVPALHEGGFEVSLAVFNLLGQKVITLYQGVFGAGTYNVKWNGLDQSGNQVSSGIYIYKIVSENFSQSKRMTLLK